MAKNYKHNYLKKGAPQQKKPRKKRRVPKEYFKPNEYEDFITRITNDIEKHHASFYIGDSIYIHRNVSHFTIGANKVNGILRTEISNLVSAFSADAEELIRVCEQNEEAFFSRLNSTMAQLNPRLPTYTRENFAQLFQQQFMQFFDVELTQLKGELAQIPQGKKKIGELQALAAWFQKLGAQLQKWQLNDYLDQDFNNKLKQRNDDIRSNFTEKLPEGVDPESYDLPGTRSQIQQMVQGLSTGSANFHLLPAIIEAMVAKTFDNFAVHLVNHNLAPKATNVSSKTGKGTAGDVEYLQAQFSVKTNKKDLRQTKNRKLTTFFNWNATLDNNDNIKINNVYSILRSDQNNILNIIKYLVMNYATLNNSDVSVLQDAFQIIALTNLNEKIFGYNKDDQKSISLAELMPQFPIAVINSAGQIVYMKEIMQQVIQNVQNDFASIKKMATVSISRHHARVDKLNEKKAEVIKASTLDENVYPELAEKVADELKNVNAELNASLKINIAYKINYDKIIQQIQK